jgi:hypothetical protein
MVFVDEQSRRVRCHRVPKCSCVRKEDSITRQAYGMRMVSNIGIEWEAEGQLAWQRNQILVTILPRIDIPGGCNGLKPSNFSKKWFFRQILESAARSNQAGKDCWLRDVFEYLYPDIIGYFVKLHTFETRSRVATIRSEGYGAKTKLVMWKNNSYLSYLHRHLPNSVKVELTRKLLLLSFGRKRGIARGCVIIRW